MADRCPDGQHDYREEKTWEEDGKTYQLLRCSKCGRSTVAWTRSEGGQ